MSARGWGEGGDLCGWWAAHHALRPAWRRPAGKRLGRSYAGWGRKTNQKARTPCRPTLAPLQGPHLGRPGSRPHRPPCPRLASTGPPGPPAFVRSPHRGTKGGERGRSRTPACPSPFLSFPPLDWKPPQESEETRSASALGVKSRDFPSKILPPKLFPVQGTRSPAGEAFLGVEIGWGRALRNPAQSQLFLCGHRGA